MDIEHGETGWYADYPDCNESLIQMIYKQGFNIRSISAMNGEL